ncbi:MAG: GTP cyclohydrolase I FolE [Candidatus Bipolaricaulota bacterium]|nr:GTP cyclohydrolase I FolE [Candidatus Bipolaricaulota bacterium]
MDRTKVEHGARLLMEGLGLDLNQEGLHNTPKRIAAMFIEDFFRDIERHPREAMTTFFHADYDEMVAMRDIPFHSVCEHHLLPFVGKAAVVYIPKDKRIVGASKLARAVEIASSRPQLQERMTSQLADVFMETLRPHGVLVRIEAEHLCMTLRGVKKPGTRMVTTGLRGLFKSDAAARSEALSAI